jgi:hypothetical protein
MSFLSRLRAATDTFYDHIYYSGSLSVQAHREGMTNSLRGPALAQFVKERRANPPDNYKAKAVADARTRTARRKLRGRYVGLVAAIVWLSSGLYFLTNASGVSPFATVAYLAIGVVVATIFIGGLFQIFFGLSNFLQLAIIGMIEGVVGRLSGRERVRPSDVAFELALRLVFGAGLFAIEALVTILVARWAFEYFVV